MNYRLRFLEEARSELMDAVSWYELQVEGLGERFLGNALKLTELIVSQPELFQVKQSGYREAKVTHFPFLLIYRIELDEQMVIIVAVFHTKRDPEGKYEREA
ncbi:MAG: type II toxin-antitoxin system RelE/ParE family toxin [Bacteroidia bacterium]